MARVLAATGGLLLAIAGCDRAPVGPAGDGGGSGGRSDSDGGGGAREDGGAVGSGGVGTGGQGGRSGSGGAPATGGAPGRGGSGGGTGGGGTNGTGGAASAGAGGGGRGTGGVGTGGAGTGGAGTGGAGTGGAGTGGVGGAAPLPSVAELFPAGPDGSLDGRLVTVPCTDGATIGTDCGHAGAYYRGMHIRCIAGALDVVHTYPVGGVTGRTYTVALHFYGIVGPRVYATDDTTVIRDAAPGRPGDQNAGVSPTPWAAAPGGHVYLPNDYATYEIRVRDPSGQEIAVYYLNADSMQGHWTWVLDFEKSIAVVGGGSVLVRQYNRNCRIIKNCGPNGTPANQCATQALARVIDVSAAVPAPASGSAIQGGLLQPNLVPERATNNSGQWLLIDVVRVVSAM
jgi:hypothetical protein